MASSEKRMFRNYIRKSIARWVNSDSYETLTLDQAREIIRADGKVSSGRHRNDTETERIAVDCH